MDNVGTTVGMTFTFPGEADSVGAFWDLLVERKCAVEEVPRDRFDINAFWASTAAVDVQGEEMLRTLHRGQYTSLNLYFTSGFFESTGARNTSPFYGVCSFPLPLIRDRLSDISFDGCILDFRALPGSSDRTANIG